ncbi:cupin domain [Streptomyces puniciscabiei]|uniref:Cupin domain n=1 Tax=Streptomyces puniciscabiei TaxID=164348 RepID=A0A542UJT6_9ACTN|nr:cupin domain-containing protein [Streptomyces puniciscabiei]TQK99337.1 cupin domain [Streptomyces puniciscabiei]
MTITTVDLFSSMLDFRPDGGVLAGARRMTEGDPGSWQVAAFHVETDADVHADHWEVHPAGEEAVCCLAGGVRLYVRPTAEGGAEEMVRLAPGTAVIVPRGRWHRLELDAPSDLMSITRRGGSRLEKRTGLCG